MHCAAAIWDIAGACLDRMGPAAEPAVHHLREQLALPHRAGTFTDIDNDEELQRISRTVLARFE